MAVLVISEFPGLSRGDADQWAPMVSRMRRQPGLVMYADGPTHQGWRAISVWKSRDDFEHFYDTTIKPNMPPGAPIRDAVSELRHVVVRGSQRGRAGGLGIQPRDIFVGD